MTAKERPILFQPGMARLVHDGLKTQTRQMVKSQPVDESTADDGDVFLLNGVPMMALDKGAGLDYYTLPCPYGVHGDYLWVREAWRPQWDGESWFIQYRAGGTFEPNEVNVENQIAALSRADKKEMKDSMAWRPSIYMPRWACRTVLEVTRIRVERVQDISDDDAYAEGYKARPFYAELDAAERVSQIARLSGMKPSSPATAWYRDLWDEINGAGSWAANPWVWVIDFVAQKGGG